MKKFFSVLLLTFFSFSSVFANSEKTLENLIKSSFNNNGSFNYQGFEFQVFNPEEFKPNHYETLDYTPTAKDLKLQKRIKEIGDNLASYKKGIEKLVKINNKIADILNGDLSKMEIGRVYLMLFLHDYFKKKLLMYDYKNFFLETIKAIDIYKDLSTFKKTCSEVNHQAIVNNMKLLGFGDYTIEESKKNTRKKCEDLLNKLEFSRTKSILGFKGQPEAVFYILNELNGNEYKLSSSSSLGTQYCVNNSYKYECYVIYEKEIFDIITFYNK